jgi:hypothetical protein
MSGERIFRISRHHVALFFSGGQHRAYEVFENPIPRDAEIVRCRMHFESGDVEFVLRSAEWSPNAEGTLLEKIRPCMRYPKEEATWCVR